MAAKLRIRAFRTKVVTIDGEDFTHITALFKGQEVGTALLQIGDSGAWLENVNVPPPYRRLRIGTALLGKAYDLAAEAGCTTLRLAVWRAGAKAFYLALRGTPKTDPEKPGFVTFWWSI